MTATLKDKTQLVVPESVQRQAGMKAGDRVEFSVTNGIIKIQPVERTYRSTKAEEVAIRKGEGQIERGEYVTLDELLHEMDRSRRKSGAKATRKSSR